MQVSRYLQGDENAKEWPAEGNMIKSIHNYFTKILVDFKQRPAKPDMWNYNIDLPENGHEAF
jgi:hypothetical protein